MKSVLNPQFLIWTAVFSFGYLLINIYFTNWSILNQTFLGNYSIEYKLKLSMALIEGLQLAMSPLNFYSLIVISVLSGANGYLVLLLMKRQLLQKPHLIFGLGSMFGLAGSGCASCGLPLLGLIGLSSSAAYLPLKGSEVSLLSVILLAFSFVYLLRKQNSSCKVKLKNGI